MDNNKDVYIYSHYESWIFAFQNGTFLTICNQQSLYRTPRRQFIYSLKNTRCLIPVWTQIFVHNLNNNANILTKFAADLHRSLCEMKRYYRKCWKLSRSQQNRIELDTLCFGMLCITILLTVSLSEMLHFSNPREIIAFHRKQVKFVENFVKIKNDPKITKEINFNNLEIILKVR